MAAERTRDLVAAEESRDLALDAAQVGLWGGDILTNTWHSDARANRMLGSPESDPRDLDLWTRAMHPDDRERVREEFDAAVRGEKLYDVEYRIVWPDGSIHHILARGRVSRDEPGRPVRMDGVMYDMTGIRAADARLRLDRGAGNGSKIFASSSSRPMSTRSSRVWPTRWRTSTRTERERRRRSSRAGSRLEDSDVLQRGALPPGQPGQEMS